MGQSEEAIAVHWKLEDIIRIKLILINILQNKRWSVVLLNWENYLNYKEYIYLSINLPVLWDSSLLFFEEDVLFARLGNINWTICCYITDLIFNETIRNCHFLQKKHDWVLAISYRSTCFWVVWFSVKRETLDNEQKGIWLIIFFSCYNTF